MHTGLRERGVLFERDPHVLVTPLGQRRGDVQFYRVHGVLEQREVAKARHPALLVPEADNRPRGVAVHPEGMRVDTRP